MSAYPLVSSTNDLLHEAYITGRKDGYATGLHTAKSGRSLGYLIVAIAFGLSLGFYVGTLWAIVTTSQV